MNRHAPGPRLRLLVSTTLLSLLVSALPMGVVRAAVTVTPATGGTAISADTVGAAYTTLAGPSLAASAAADFGTGDDIVLNVPAGFVFRAGFGGVTTSGGCTGIVLAALVVTTTTATLDITTGPSDACTITFTGLEVRPTAGTPLASGNITNTGSAGPGGATNYGTLTEVPGTAVLTFSTQPSAANTAAVAFATQPTVH